MKSKITLLCLLIVINFSLKAQTYVTIPDSNFAAWLQLKYPACMNGNQMNITCSDIQNETNIDISNQSISDITGIEYFTNLEILNCGYLYLSSLPLLPNSLKVFYCDFNLLMNISNLPDSLEGLHCGNNLLTNLPNLPTTLQVLTCGSNQLTNLPVLPNSIQILVVDQNQLTNLPTLSNSLKYLYCNNNQLISLPTLPNSLLNLHCYDNQLTGLPILPNSLSHLECHNNNISCFPFFPNSLVNPGLGGFNISGNPCSCLPNYVAGMDLTDLTYPICINGDSLNNINDCPSAKGITGFIFNDTNSNCTKDSNDLWENNIPVKLYDMSNNFLGQTNSFSHGIYYLYETVGIYKVTVDTLGVPYSVACSNPDSVVNLTAMNPMISNVNFDIVCKPGFDVGVQSVYRSGWVFPGRQHRLNVIAGDISNWYNFHCAAGISGQVKITVTGPVAFDSIAFGALTPSISGNVFTYNISDFGNVNMQQDFNLLFSTDTSAQIGDTICVSVIVTPKMGDNNQSNNTYQYCYQVTNSHDPNIKEVYPVNVQSGYQDWLTYTVHFQNTGNAPATNIRMTDTLDSNVDLETFQVVNYSHYNTVLLQNKNLTFRFPHIMLPDSTSNPEGSKGFVQYRVKPKANLQLGTQIKNTANIYFDYNPAIITNTTVNEFVSAVSVNEINTSQTLSIYPNPGNGKYFIKYSDAINISKLNIEVYNLLGELILNSISQNDLTEIDLSHQPNGVYFIKATSSKQSFNQRLIKQ